MTEMEEETLPPVPTEAIWAQVEIMGHRVRVGQLREVVRFGRTMIEITRPALPALPAHEKEGMGYAGDDYYGKRVPGVHRFPEAPAMPAEVEWYSPEALFCVKELTEGEVMSLLSNGRPRTSAEFIPDPAALLEAQVTKEDEDDDEVAIL